MLLIGPYLGAPLHAGHGELVKHGAEPLVAGLVQQLVDPVQVDNILIVQNLQTHRGQGSLKHLPKYLTRITKNPNCKQICFFLVILIIYFRLGSIYFRKQLCNSADFIR